MTMTDDTVLDEEVNDDVADDVAFRNLVDRLNRQSVTKRFEAYRDIAWDDPAMQIDPEDPRWELGADDPLGRTEWYQALPQPMRAELGLYTIASKMKFGLEFESVLKRGLLEYAAKLPNGSPEFRYAYHEVIEESHHSLMFQEFVNRTQLPVRGLAAIDRFGARRVIQMGRIFPEAFFIFVLGGEDPIDHVQREVLRSKSEIHPLLERIMRIHVTEEARHLSFARHFLKQRVPQLGIVKRTIMSVQVPLTLGTMASMMLRPSRQLVRRYDIPKAVLAEAYGTEESYAEAARSLRKVRNLCVELGLVTPLSKPLWKAFHIWND